MAKKVPRAPAPPGAERPASSPVPREGPWLSLGRFGALALTGLAATWLVFAPCLAQEFRGDDYVELWRIWRFDLLRQIFNPLFRDEVFSNYRPMIELFMWACRALFDMRVAGYHVAVLCLHGGFAGAVGWLSWSLFGSFSAALAASALYGGALLHFAAVTGIAHGLGDLLYVWGVLLTFLAYRRGRYGAAAGLSLLAFLSKENAVMLPGLLITYEILRRPASPTPWKTFGVQLIKRQGAIWTLSLVMIVRTLLILSQVGSHREVFQQHTVGPHIWRNLLLGLQWLVPYHSGTAPVLYGFTMIPWAVGLALAALAAIGTAVRRAAAARSPHLPLLAFLLCWMGFGYFPWALAEVAIKQHYMGLALAAFTVLLTYALTSLVRSPWPSWVVAAAALLSARASFAALDAMHAQGPRGALASEILRETQRLVPHPEDGHTFIYAGFHGTFFSSFEIKRHAGLQLIYKNPTLQSVDFAADRVRLPAPGVVVAALADLDSTITATRDRSTVFFVQDHQWRVVTDEFFATGEPVKSWLRAIGNYFQSQGQGGTAQAFFQKADALSPAPTAP